MAAAFVDFAAVKKSVSLEQVLARSGLLDGFSRKGEKLCGPCPLCKQGGKRAFQVNLAKNVWYCFGACKRGGNVLDLVSLMEGMALREAALALDTWFALGLGSEKESEPDARPPIPPLVMPPPPPKPDEPPPAPPLPAANPPLAFSLKTLDPEHPSLEALGLRHETIRAFGIGYCKKGVLRDRIAIPIRNPQGELVAYTGLAVAGESPRYLFPTNFQPALEVWNLDRLAPPGNREGPLFLCPEVLGALRLSDPGTAFLSLFDGSLSEAQEALVAHAAASYDGLVLVGEGFPDRTVARLARHAPLTWFLRRPSDERS